MANLSDFKPTGADTNNLGPIRGVPSTNQGQVNTSLLIGSSDVIVGEGSLVASDANFSVSIDGPNAINKSLQFRTGSNPRWELLVDNSPESDPTAPSVATKLANPATLPSFHGREVTFSPDGTLMVVGHDASPFITIYERSGDTFTKLADPATLPTNRGNGLAFSRDGTILAVAHPDGSFLTIYERSVDNVFTKLPDPAVLPTQSGLDAAFSPDDTLLVITHSATPFITIYERSGTTFTGIAGPDVLPPHNTFGVDFSPDGTHMAVAHFNSPHLIIYKRSGNSFTKLPNPSTLPPGTGQGVSFSPDGRFLAVAHDVSPFITIYERSGDKFTKLANPATLPPSNGASVHFSPDNTHLAVGHNTSPYITVYERSGNTFTKLANPAVLPASTGHSVSFSPDGTHMAVAHSTSPNITIYDSPVGVNINGGSNFSIRRYDDAGSILNEPIKIVRETGAITFSGVTTINSGPLAGFRNALINGNFDLWQRGTSSTFTSFRYISDRWLTGGGDGQVTVTRESFALGQTGVPGEPEFFVRISQDVAASASSPAIIQRVEDVRTFASKQVTLSFFVKTATGTQTITPRIVQSFGTGGSPSASVVVTGETVTATTSWQKIVRTFSLPSLAGKTIGTDGNDRIEVNIIWPLGSTPVLDFAQMQLEQGSVASEFERRPLETELELAQRYYWKTFDIDTTPAQNAGDAGTFQTSASANGRFILGGVQHAVMRGTPTITTFNPSAANSSARNITDNTDVSVFVVTSVGGKIYLGPNTLDANNADDRIFIHVTADAEL